MTETPLFRRQALEARRDDWLGRPRLMQPISLQIVAWAGFFVTIAATGSSGTTTTAAKPVSRALNVPMVGPDRARTICNNRPFESWDDVDRLDGFDNGMIDDLKSGGAQSAISEQSVKSGDLSTDHVGCGREFEPF